MGTAIIAQGANFENSGSGIIIPPVSRGLLSWSVLNSDLNKASRNYLDGRNHSVVGTPGVSLEATTFTGNLNYLNTNIPDSGSSTIFFVGKLGSTYSSVATIVGDYANGTSPSLSLSIHSDGILRLSAFRSDNSGGSTNVQSQLTGQDLNSYGLYVAVCPNDGTSPQYVKNLASGAVSAANPNVNSRVLNGTRNLRIGGSYNSAYSGVIDLSVLVLHSVALTEDEIARQSVFIRKYANSRGISV